MALGSKRAASLPKQPVKSTPCTAASRKSTPAMCASLKEAPVRSALMKLEPSSLADVKSAPRRSARVKSALRTSARRSWAPLNTASRKLELTREEPTRLVPAKLASWKLLSSSFASTSSADLVTAAAVKRRCSRSPRRVGESAAREKSALTQTPRFSEAPMSTAWTKLDSVPSASLKLAPCSLESLKFDLETSDESKAPPSSGRSCQATPRMSQSLYSSGCTSGVLMQRGCCHARVGAARLCFHLHRRCPSLALSRPLCTLPVLCPGRVFRRPPERVAEVGARRADAAREGGSLHICVREPRAVQVRLVE
mmetsp:Transcript_4993/g.16065  ORF Transcript_4993/g.16065 Transcript_4993/m.16065 type:complete len:310 (+) Transcript_4993:76-1005(+)